MTTANAQSLDDDTEHVFTRYGRAIRLRVIPLDSDESLGHALIFGRIEPDCLVRIHSRCLYGDALHSDDCDCGPELELALDMIQAEGCGVLLYLEQEGRGAGLIGKARGYALSQREHLDTFASYAKLGLPPDARTYTAAAKTLLNLGLCSVRLLTNNPDKEAQLRAAGVAVHPVPLLVVPGNPWVHQYLQAKREHRGHRLPQGWGTHRALRALSGGTCIAVFGGICAGAAGFIAAGVDGRWVLPVVSAATALAGLAIGRFGPQRTRLLRARIRLTLARGSRP
ncbi:GTP cyclohydrolase II [Nocardia sp. CDC153]|uniref:GTP cyclohydrolase II n=1 Tax=Nocardia sp. CDC153 TaxID=3112167 RepID=UPI002DB626B5|nr:GTP cyclohydrolase II [Nocardia sp. CDC153]MEC3956329.1 GTP cyclohydrolase II [Nocardia sp. CDC153]